MKNILYICELPAYHVANELAALKDNNFNVIVLNVFKASFSKVENYDDDVVLYNLHNNLKNYPSVKMLETMYQFYINYKFIDEIIFKHKIDILYSSWSSMVILDAYFLKKRFPHLKWIHRYLMYPASLNKLKVNIENFFLKKYTNYIDHIIFHTGDMKDYFIKNVNSDFKSSSILFEKFNNLYFLEDEQYLNSLSGKFSLIFLGRISPNSENNILKELEALPLEIDIYINIKDEFKYLISNENIKFFDKKKIGIELNLYIQKFDGILSFYNENSIKKERINLVIPNRITLGIPALKRFFIPGNQLFASKKLLKSFDLLCEYNTNNDLVNLLKENRKKPLNKEKIKNQLVLDKEFTQIFDREM
jgi:hypothetical protein